MTAPETPRLSQEVKDGASALLLKRLEEALDDSLASLPRTQQPPWFQRHDDQRAAGTPGASPYPIVMRIMSSEGDGPNPLLIEALRYYGERHTLANPKGWARVLRAVNQGIDANLIPSTPEQQEEAREVLQGLVEADRVLADGNSGTDDQTTEPTPQADPVPSWLTELAADSDVRLSALPRANQSSWFQEHDAQRTARTPESDPLVLVAQVLARHVIPERPRHISPHAWRSPCSCGGWQAPAGYTPEGVLQQARLHVARELATAGLIPTQSRWAVERQSRHDGPFDRRETTGENSRTPLTEDEARRDVELRTGPRGQFTPETLRVAVQYVTDWRPAP